MAQVQVIDAICGSGKTTWMFKHIKENSTKKWIFVSPYLDEAGDGRTKGRIQEELPEMHFFSPAAKPTKKADFLWYINKGKNVAITHKLFTDFTPDIALAIEKQGYELVIDETIDLVSFYEDINGDDVKLLIKAGMVLVGNKGKLDWNAAEWPKYSGRDVDIKNLCELGCLYLYGDDVLIQRIPPTCMQACNSVTVLTYLFEGSLMQAWMKLNNIEYKYCYPDALKAPSTIKNIIKQKLDIVEPSKTILDLQVTDRGEYIHTAFSKGWYDKAPAITLNAVKKSIEKSLKDKRLEGETFWTTFKDYKEIMQGKGYTRRKKIKGLTELRDPFVPKNMRASNEYKDCVYCIYTVNVYPHGSIDSHLRSFGIELNKDKYALSELIQFMFRGCIREGNEMQILVLSNRMRKLLTNWLNSDEDLVQVPVESF